jgi:hypothetical protein
MSLKLLNIINESKQYCEYQVRDIGGGDVYYKRCGKNKKWAFTDEVDFLRNSKSKNIVKWEKPKDKKSKIRQEDFPKKEVDKLDYLKIYYTNLSPDGYEIKIEGDKITILPS